MLGVSRPRRTRSSRLGLTLAALALATAGLGVACSSLVGADFTAVHPPASAEPDAGCGEDACGACIPEGESCAPSASCCGGTICNASTAKCQVCGSQGVACASDADCCADFACDTTVLTCQPSATCGTNGEGCIESSTCCSGVCNARERVCDACGTAGKICSADADCCEGDGFVCNPTSSTCTLTTTCTPSGSACGEGGAACCPTLVCNSVFSACQACGGKGSSCNVDADCCTGTTCNTSEHECQAGPISCGLEAAPCAYAASCCEGLYCDVAAAADGGAKSCTSAPQCKELGETCATYADCCEGQGTAGTTCCLGLPVGGCGDTVVGCCIGSQQDTTHILCHEDGDCCSDSCDTATGQCN